MVLASAGVLLSDYMNALLCENRQAGFIRKQNRVKLIHSLSASPAAMVDQHQGHPRENIGMSRTNLLARSINTLWELPVRDSSNQNMPSLKWLLMDDRFSGFVTTPPHAGIITAVRLDRFGSQENIYLAKSNSPKPLRTAFSFVMAIMRARRDSQRVSGNYYCAV